MARGRRRARAACTSMENADSSCVARQFVLVTHPFHPLFGRQLPCVGKRYNRYGERLLLQAADLTEAPCGLDASTETHALSSTSSAGMAELSRVKRPAARLGALRHSRQPTDHALSSPPQSSTTSSPMPGSETCCSA
jgi:hypothetical protein